MKGKHPHRTKKLRNRLLEDEVGRKEYLEQRVISELGGIIEQVLQQRHLTQSALARAANIAQPDLNALIRGRAEHIPTLLTLSRLTQALKVPLVVSIDPSGTVSVRQGKTPRVAV